MINGVIKYQPYFTLKVGPVYALFILFFAVVCAYSFYTLLNIFKKSYGVKRNQIRYVFIAYFFAFLSAVMHFGSAYGLKEIFPHDIFVIICMVLLTYAIIAHRLMDIEVVIKKTIVFASLFTIVFGIFVGITVLIQQFIGNISNLVRFAVSSLVIIFTVRPLEIFLVRITDKYLFQKKYDYKQVLKSFIDEVITVLSLDQIAKSTLDLLDKTLHPETSAILLLNRYDDKYISYEKAGYGKDIVLESKSKIPALLKTTKDIFSIEKSAGVMNINEELRDEVKQLDARLAVPLMLHDDLIGIMLLGKKKSDEDYSKEDLDILTDLARTEAIAIGNAQLFSEAAQNERRAAIGTLAAGINHEIGNPLNIINTKMQVYLMSLDQGLYKDKRPEDIIKESKDIMNLCLQQTTRISDITKKLSSFAKPSKDFRPEATDIEEQIDETLAVVGHDLELGRVEMRKNIAKGLSKISADKRQIQQVFFNIIRNAGQAIKEKGVIEIKAYDSADGNVKIEISDTGVGIPEDKLDKIYEPFYTTKAPGKGTGLGLSIVRQLVWRNKGDIKVKSRVGEGTTFIITFPAAKT